MDQAPLPVPTDGEPAVDTTVVAESWPIRTACPHTLTDTTSNAGKKWE